ncbi:MAG: hypothetical protein NC433_02550 [Clostridiales bacterium]|nr:hypothetical protein [Clostridiales bacterium]
MRQYQEEYIANLRDIATLNMRGKQENMSFEEFAGYISGNRKRAEQKIIRNMELLRDNLFPVLDRIFDADEDELKDLHEFTDNLNKGKEELDIGLFCQLHKAFLSVERQKKNRNGIIRELYWLGMGYYGLCNKLVGTDYDESEKYIMQMRLCFAEAAAYLKYYDEIDDTQTRGYILRARANMALGRFRVSNEKIHMVKHTLQILNDKSYQEKEPDLPWDRYIYMTHQQMAASISYGKENHMTPQDIEDVMESAYIVYQRRLQEAAANNEPLMIRPQYSCNVIDYYCGMETLDGLLTKLEALMDAVEPEDFSENGMYGIISMPAFYCQFLLNNPEKIPRRKKYVKYLYNRLFTYMDAFPDTDRNELLFLYLRQLTYTFVEIEGGVTYKEFLKKLQMCFAPDQYVRARVVGEASAAFCRIIMEEDKEFFDDIDEIRDIEDLDRKKSEVENYALECGRFYDIGRMCFMNLYSRIIRQWFDDEYEMSKLHTIVGAQWLEGRPSTKRYAAVARGHHSWYDGVSGYPNAYKRLDCPYRQMVDVIALIDWLDNMTDTERLYMGEKKTFDEAVEEAVKLEGKRFSPLLTARLRDKQVVEQIRTAFDKGRAAAYRELYRG